MTEWWDALRLDLQIFYALGILSTLALGLQFVMMFLGFGDHDAGGGHDVGGAHDGHGDAHSDGFSVISVRTITAFFIGFGWTGALAVRKGLHTFVAILIAFLVGLFFMAVVYGLIWALYRLRVSGAVNYKNAIGQVGDVYVTVPAKQSSSGQVQVMVQGRMRVVSAFTRAGSDLLGGSKIKVVGLIDERTLLVEPLTDSKQS